MLHCRSIVDALPMYLMHCRKRCLQCIKCMSVHIAFGVDALSPTTGRTGESASSASNIAKKQTVTEWEKTAANREREQQSSELHTLFSSKRLMHLMHLMHCGGLAL